jgi:hypothetical protein
MDRVRMPTSRAAGIYSADPWLAFLATVFERHGSRARAGLAAAERLGKGDDRDLARQYAATYGDYIAGRTRPKPRSLWTLASDVRAASETLPAVAPWAAGPVMLYAASEIELLVAVFAFAYWDQAPPKSLPEQISQLVIVTFANPAGRLVQSHDERPVARDLGNYTNAQDEATRQRSRARRVWTLSKDDIARYDQAWVKVLDGNLERISGHHNDDLVIAFALARDRTIASDRLVLQALLRWASGLDARLPTPLLSLRNERGDGYGEDGA